MANLAQVNGLDWQCWLAGSSKRAPRIFIFSIVLGAENLSYMKSIETHARAFLPLNISAISSVFTEFNTSIISSYSRLLNKCRLILVISMAIRVVEFSNGYVHS